MTRFHIDVLGPFRVLAADGSEIRIPSGKLSALLQCLVYEEQGVDRDRLQTMLWPDSDQESGRHSLRQALSAIRVKLGADPFSGTTWISLNRAVCNSDSWVLHERYANRDYLGCLELVRGPLSMNEPKGASGPLYASWEPWADTVKRLVHLSCTRAALAADQIGDDSAVDYAINQGALVGLSEVGLRNEIAGGKRLGPGWSDRQIGLNALTSLVFRSRRGMRSALALVIEREPGWTSRSVRAAMSQLPSHTCPALIEVPAQRPLAHVSSALSQLPGGAGISRDAEQTFARLAQPEPYPFDDVTAQLSAVNALADALDASCQEQALVFIVNVKDLKQSTATTFAQAITRYGGEGLTVFLCGEHPEDMERTEALTLTGAVDTRRHIVQFEPARPENHRGSTDLSEQAPPPPTDGRQHAGWAVITVTVALLTSFTTLQVSAPNATPEVTEVTEVTEDIIFCSDRGGAPQYYRWGQGWGVERISPDTALCRRSGITVANADSVYLPTLAGGEVKWRSYPNERFRGNLSGTPLPFDYATPATISGDLTTFIVLSDGQDLWTLFDVSRQDTVTVPLPRGGHIVDMSERFALVRSENARGRMSHYVVDRESGEITFETGGELDEVNAHWTASGEIVLARGRQGTEEDGSLDLVVADPASGSEVILTQNDWNDYGLVISSDRTQICWQSEEFGHYEQNIQVMDLRTRMKRPIVQISGRQEGCGFVADGSLLVYHSRDRGEIDLMMQSVDGSPPIRILGTGTSRFVMSVPIR